MSPRLIVGEVSIATDGSPPWPPGRIRSLAKVGLPPPPPGAGFAAADIGIRAATTRTVARAAVRRLMLLLSGRGDARVTRRTGNAREDPDRNGYRPRLKPGRALPARGVPLHD